MLRERAQLGTLIERNVYDIVIMIIMKTSWLRLSFESVLGPL